MQATKTIDVLALLARHEVQFIVVGMTAAVLQGTPAVTFDLDILYARTPDNIIRLLAALSELEAVFRNTSGRRIAPNASHLESAGHKLLETKMGPLDVLGTIEETTTYEQAREDSVVVTVGETPVRALGLERLIAVKEKAGRSKDLAVLPLLRATLARIKPG